MSPTDSNLSGGRSKRKSGKPGRFDPSEPLHMTTRRAARSKSNGGSPSVNGSVDGDYSRRGSLDDSRPSTSHTNSSEYSIKSRRTSNGSVAIVSPAVTPNGLPYPHKPIDPNEPSLALTSTQQSPSPSRKRKRSPSTRPPPMRSATPSALADEPVQSLETTADTIITHAPNNDIIEEAKADGDAVQLVPQEDLSDREASQNSSQSNEQRLKREVFDDQSAEDTPAASNAASPPSGNSDLDEQLTLSKPEDAAMEDEAEGDLDENVEPNEEMDLDTEMIEEADEAEEAEDGDDANGQVQSGSSAERPRRRFGGRRRAQHPIAKVEKAMQRQAEIKAWFRTVARALKPVLAEIAKRTVDDLEANPESHTEALEYPGVVKQLGERLEKRQRQIRLQHNLMLDQLNRNRDQYSEAAKMTCNNMIEDAEDLFFARIEAEIVRIEREAQMNSTEEGYATEDEDGVLPRPKSTSYGFKVASTPLAEEYLSRSRVYLEPKRALAEQEARTKMRALLGLLPENERPVAPKRKFAVMDDGPRNAALARKEANNNFDILAEAAAETVRADRATKKQRTIRNEDCYGLQLLGDLASRPSLTATTKPPKGSHPPRASSRPMPPQLQIQTGYHQSPIPVEMSPRTTQAMGDRFDGAMLPPTTPRRAAGPPTLLRSPEVTRTESTLPSPMMNMNRFNNPQPPLMRPPDGRPESRRSQLMELARPGPDMPRPPPEQRPEIQFSPSQQTERRVEFPLWREYPREDSGSLRRRSSSQNERPPINMHIDPRLRDERQSAISQRLQEAPKAPETPREIPPPPGQMHGRAPLWQDRPSQPGATDIRFHDQRSPPHLPQRPIFDRKSPQHSRNSSMTFNVQDFQYSGILPKEDPNQPRSKGPISTFKTKTTKEERDGLSRRNWTNQRKMSKPLGGTGPAGSPPLGAATAGSPAREVPPPPSPWHAQQHPQHSSPVPPPPVPSYQQPPYPPPPSQAGFRPAQHAQEQFPNRNSFTPRPSASSFDRLPPTPLYVMPQQQQQQQSQPQDQPQQHPPPPGVPPEQYNRPFAPPPQAGYQPPPPPPHSVPPHQSPQTPFPQPAQGSSYMSQFGGPPLAPARGNAYHPPGFRPAPAFAQQAKQHQQQAQQQGGVGNRRRTQSDAGFAKFQPWNPPAPKRS